VDVAHGLLIAFGVFIFLMTVTVHEYCHGFLANRLGDSTAREAGRLSLNPLRHIDPFWTVLLPLLLFIGTRGQFAIGMARPVPVNFLNLRNPKRDMVWVAAAGPFANFVLAGFLAAVFKFFPLQLLLYAVYFNIGLGVFNLIPIPPLDGSRIVLGLLPAPLAQWYVRLEPFGFLIVLALYFSGALYAVLIPSIHFICQLLGIPKIEF
jgi:Zn-dependent protease